MMQYEEDQYHLTQHSGQSRHISQLPSTTRQEEGEDGTKTRLMKWGWKTDSAPDDVIPFETSTWLVGEDYSDHPISILVPNWTVYCGNQWRHRSKTPPCHRYKTNSDLPVEGDDQKLVFRICQTVYEDRYISWIFNLLTKGIESVRTSNSSS